MINQPEYLNDCMFESSFEIDVHCNRLKGEVLAKIPKLVHINWYIFTAVEALASWKSLRTSDDF